MLKTTSTAPQEETVLSYSATAVHRKGESTPVPETRAVRDLLLAAVRTYAAANRLVPPLSMSELEGHAGRVLDSIYQDRTFRVFVMVLLYNESWREMLSAVPFSKRILLMPPCMRSSTECSAEFDELGLVCRRCSKCNVGPLAEEAEALGYAVLVAEGTSTVTTLIESGQMQGAIGASCMAALERAFPHMAEQPIPSLAIPLTKDGCKDTEIDIDWLREALHLESAAAAAPLDLDAIHDDVSSWFTVESLRDALGTGNSPTEAICLDWLAKSGKRWRPFLTMGVFRALQSGEDGVTEAAKKVAIAVESIHKASLCYDDMQDGDAIRYGEPTVHAVHGIPLALNVGLDLLGHGYRLIAEAGAPDAQTAAMLSLAARGHCTLCVGQGDELLWARHPEPLSVARVLEMFRLKTAPSFMVVFGLGAILGGADQETLVAIAAYSEALGVAYQIKDDLCDFQEGGDVDDVRSGRASLTLTVAYERADERDRDRIRRVWEAGATADEANELRALLQRYRTEEETGRLLTDYRNKSLDALRPLRNARLRIFLHQVAGRVLGTR